MIFFETKLKGAYIIKPEKITDERGFFARSFCQKEFNKYSLNSNFVQCNISYNKIKGTLRGMHYQNLPYPEAKLVRCTQGAIYDVIIDLRKNSPTFKHWIGEKLTAKNHKMIYIPEGFAHGFQTLEDDSEVFYQMSEFYYPECAKGIKFDDPNFKIEWPIINKIISERDISYHLWDE
ncbi:dTDP-4-dehydrorhamnose 3,5-epimerase [Geminocystis sp. NIES-3709]|uniref:dTDP-4-dehydrorhamnose 3,5-epimerase n=1 Tax=Geminocystis sp. NIES-3709 TaxID=1617448 RepID=UPI0005FCDB86|nr:dTDP-4-dehydrorhamnose 3,5-epimerase [Geminocystis sp. NIES-3709]BAQ63637.1 dTDP-4-dehydrorhamnose 3,5-epimerase [Geminocystis sp. NIES-3709]